MTQEAEDSGVRLPHETADLFGHADAELALLCAYRDGRFPHAWLLCGPPGVGKATLAYRFARYLLAHPDPAAGDVQAATSLAVDPSAPAARRVAARADGDLLVLERTLSDSGVLRTEIQVDNVRRTVGFFGNTAAGGGWRICIVDAADDLNRSGANALLKAIEEPPARALFLLVAHQPGRLLPTIRSRCRTLQLKPLAANDVAAAVSAATGRPKADPEITEAAAAAGGRVARALELLSEGRLALRRSLQRLLAELPAIDDRALHALGDNIGRANEGAYDFVVDSMRDWLSAQLRREPANLARLARIAQVWEKLDTAARETEALNLERKPMVFAAFGLLAEAARHP